MAKAIEMMPKTQLSADYIQSTADAVDAIGGKLVHIQYFVEGLSTGTTVTITPQHAVVNEEDAFMDSTAINLTYASPIQIQTLDGASDEFSRYLRLNVDLLGTVTNVSVRAAIVIKD